MYKNIKLTSCWKVKENKMIKINIQYLEQLKTTFEKSPRENFPKSEIVKVLSELVELAKAQFELELSEMEKDLKQISSKTEQIALKNKALHIIKKGER